MHLKQQFSGVSVVQVVHVEHVQLFKVKYSHQRKWYTERVSQWTQACMSTGLFSGRSVVHMPSYLPVLLRVACPLHSNWGGGGKGTVTWGMFPRGCEGAVTRRCFLHRGLGYSNVRSLTPYPLSSLYSNVRPLTPSTVSSLHSNVRTLTDSP